MVCAEGMTVLSTASLCNLLCKIWREGCIAVCAGTLEVECAGISGVEV